MSNEIKAQAPAPQAAAAPVKSASYNRKFLNYLLQPYLQSRIGLYLNGLALVFAVFVVWVLYSHLDDLIQHVVILTDMKDEVYQAFDQQMRGAKIWLFLGTALFLSGNVILSIFQTHRFIGPTVAFRRHIRDLANGEYTKRVTIRRGDAFAEVAYELNRLAHILENREKEKEKEHEKKP